MNQGSYKIRRFECVGCHKIVEERRPADKTKFCTQSCCRSFKSSAKDPNYHANYYLTNKHKLKIVNTKYYNRFPEKLAYRRKKESCARYGITTGDFDDLLKKQNGRCAICGNVFDHLKKRNVHIDHDHKTGVVRGLLCHHCNTGLGLFKENVDLLQSAQAYMLQLYK
jgi:hypothetical protein